MQDFFRGDENVLKLGIGAGCTTLKMLKTTDLYTLKGWILRYVNYISIKLLFKNKVKKAIT